MKRSVVILLVLVSLKTQASTDCTIESQQETHKVYEAILTLIKAKAVDISPEHRIQINDQLIQNLIQSGILKKGNAEASTICTDVIQ